MTQALLDCSHPNKRIQTLLEKVHSLSTKDMHFDVSTHSPYHQLLRALGNPHLKMRRVIHVAGTNGKGSTIAFLRSVLRELGFRVGCYTSPHLRYFNERLTIGDYNITDDELGALLEEGFEANNGRSVTFFDFTTALGFKFLQHKDVDFALIEVGLGGRDDCTNVIPDPIATVITSIGYDHMAILGENLGEIANAKAGIMKAGTPCFVAPQTHEEEVLPVMSQAASKVGSKLTLCNAEFEERIGLVGKHQLENASTAAAVVRHLALDAKNGLLKNKDLDLAIKAGLAHAAWPGRMEQLSGNPDIWFDCGHNEEGAASIGDVISTWKVDDPTIRLGIVLGLGGDKDPIKFLDRLAPNFDTLTCVGLPNARARQTAKQLSERIGNRYDLDWTEDIEEAIRSELSRSDRILITGSNYLYEAARAAVEHIK